jgi:predicted permease
LTLTIINIASATSFRTIPGASDAGRLVRVYISRNDGGPFVPYPVYKYFSDHTTSFSHLIAQTRETATTAWNLRSDDSEQVEVTLASGNYFTGLGITPAAGRFMTDDDLSPGPAASAVISYGLWQRHFNLRPEAIGAAARLNGHLFTIIGVAPRPFTGAQVGVFSDVWIPITMAEAVTGRSDLLSDPDGGDLMVVGRLLATSSRAWAEAELDVLAKQFDAEFPSRSGSRGAVVRRGTGVGPPLEIPLLLFLAALLVVGLMTLLVAGTNSATLLLMRAEERRSDTAVRLALGADRGDIIRRQLCETCTLALVAGATACLIVVISSRLLSAWLPTELPVTIDFTPDLRVFGIALGGSVLLGVILSVAPAIRGIRTEVTRSIVRGEGPTASPTTSRSRRLLMFLQASAAMTLVVSASVLSRSIDSATRVDLGFPTSDLHVVSISNGRTRDPERRRQLLTQVEQRASSDPGLTAATIAWFFPFSQATDKVVVSRPDGGKLVRADYNIVGRTYFDAIGISIVRGQGFATSDQGVVINEHLATQTFGGEDPLGQVVVLEPFGARQVIGIARQAKYRAPWESPLPYVYFPFSRSAPGGVSLLVRTAPGASERILPDLVRDIRTLEPDLTGVTAESFEDSIREVFLWTRITRVFFSIAAFAALSIAAVGVYATISYSIRQRTREIAIRVALGATRHNITRWITRQTGVMVVGGAVVGSIVATVLALALTQMPIISVQGDDPVPYVGALALFMLAIVLAIYLATRRVDAATPWNALRSE